MSVGSPLLILLAGGLSACGRSEPPPALPPTVSTPPMSTPSSVPATELWARTDRVEGSASEGSVAEGAVLPGAREALSRCKGREPCVLERFRSESTGATLLLLRSGPELLRLDPPESWQAEWSSASLLLRACLGDPLGPSPAEDPGALRVLEQQGEAWRWRIWLSGENRCRLEGELKLEARQDRVDTRSLSSDGLPWLEGGIDRARALLREQYGLPIAE